LTYCKGPGRGNSVLTDLLSRQSLSRREMRARWQLLRMLTEE
jgi:hypothetical protein